MYSPWVNYSEVHCLLLTYRLYGPEVGGLYLYIEHPDGTINKLWSRKTPYASWQTVQLTLPTGEFRLLFEAIAGPQPSTITIHLDEVFVSPGKCNKCMYG